MTVNLGLHCFHVTNAGLFTRISAVHCQNKKQHQQQNMNPECRIKRISNNIPASILYKSDVADGPITARYRFIKNAYFLIYTLNASDAILMKVLLYPYRR